jgi:4-diphosphocytidyl-2-C-methyl-D-erythritol kinase
MIRSAPAKINLALVVGPTRGDGKHEVVTVYQRVDLADRITVEPAPRTVITGFPGDTLVGGALDQLGAAHRWRVAIEKHVPVAAGLGGGSSDAATALLLANEQLPEPITLHELHALAARVGSDVPFFLHDGPQLGTGDGTTLEPLDLPQDFVVLLLLPRGAAKRSTADVYADFDGRCGAEGFEERAALVRSQLAAVRRPRDLAPLPQNDLAWSPFVDELRELGAFRADVSGAGPACYGLFHHRRDATEAARRLRGRGRVWVTLPTWYG